jgi:hypothetical protein
LQGDRPDFCDIFMNNPGYFHASLPWQFDEYVWFDETRAVSPLSGARAAAEPETHPFGL